ncbi:sugar transferase [Salinicoccus roseus]|uniref:sugar transferase n=1 Tax=Salinicoccus roseus TaxID=45670 RepID=UPI0023014174|nr:sugar transferase [Salinicoccus roseus]
MKRTFDVVAASAGLILLSPVMIGIALAIKRKMGGPVLFKQVRPGLNGEPFKLYKFRTMTDARDASGALLPDAARMTPAGERLRRWSLDELPQLINVVRGDLSLVGPRPLLMQYLPLYDSEQMRRHEVRPGITGWAQVNGRNSLSWPEKFGLDVWYVNNRTFMLDLRILLMTVIKVIRREGIIQPGESTMCAFTGNEANIDRSA